MKILLRLLNISLFIFLFGCQSQESGRLEVLFLGHSSEHHDSGKYAPLLAQHFAKEGINITYSEEVSDLNSEFLELFDAIILYANHDSITASQESALLRFVRDGKGFIPLHSASWCFRNSEEVVAMMGGQFKSHGWGKFKASIQSDTHPVLDGIEEFETLDETYVHDKLNPDIEVLMTRQNEDGSEEPWTWVRNEGRGRVFYTAYGHHDSTWTNPSFLELVTNGVKWAAGDKANKRLNDYVIAALTYREDIIPNYEKRDPPPKYQLPISPEESMTHIQVPPGFKLELFASEPMIKNPINMAWDHMGRLWVIETVDYPNEVRDEDGVGDDRIKILEDTDGDGKADKVTVFAEDLNIPTSMVFTNGGVLVAQAPYFLFLQDTDGDDIADVRDKVIEGWGTSDTHAGPSNLRFGFDNKIWGTVGYSGFKGTVGDEEKSFNQVVYNISRDFRELEVYAHTTNNTWGLGFTENFDIFISTANNTHSAFVSVPTNSMRKVKGFGRDVVSKLDGHYEMHPVTPNYRQVDVFGGFTAAAGHSFYTARNYPEEYWNRIALVSEPTGHLLHRAIIEPFGAGFQEKDGWNLMASSDEWVSPVQAEVGPDGNVWVLDWYNFIVQHNPTPDGFDNGKGNAHINPLRDKKHGRIYKIIYEKGGVSETPKLNPENPQTLVAGLKNENLMWRMHAQRLLVEGMHVDAKKDLIEIVKRNANQKRNQYEVIHSIWALEGLELIDDSEVKEVINVALQSELAGVRKAAIQALPNNHEGSQLLLSHNSFGDNDLNTRLAAFIKAIYLPGSDAVGAALYEQSKLSDVSEDAWLSKAIQAAALIHKDGFISSYEKSRDGAGNEGLTQKIFLNYNTEIISVQNYDYIEEIDDISGREVLIEGRIWIPRPDELGPHMLWAHGDNENGYGVYRNEDNWSIYINQNGRTYKGETNYKIDNWFGFSFQFSKSGFATLSLDRNPILTVKAPGLFDTKFSQGLRMGKNPDGFTPVAKQLNYGEFNQTFVNVIAEFSTPGEERNPIKADHEIALGVVPLKMEFDQDTLEVEAGKTLSIILNNADFMQHNLLILEPGSLTKVGQAADQMVTQSDAAERSYIPDMPEVLFATGLVNPNDQTVLTFEVPETPGVYPFVCTFPGHWRTMNGILIVK